MSPGEPIAYLILGIKAGKKHDTVDVLPSVSEAGLQRQFIFHCNKAHHFVRCILLHAG